MKELDLKVICAEIEAQIENKDYDLVDLIGSTLTEMVVMNIYLTNDVLKAHGQNLQDLDVSIISTSRKISVIYAGAMSWMKDYANICIYEDLTEDISNILGCIQVCFDRMDM